MSRKKKPRNNDYDPQKLEEAVVQRRIAKENNDLKKLKEAELIIYQYLEKYIRSELSYKYQPVVLRFGPVEILGDGIGGDRILEAAAVGVAFDHAPAARSFGANRRGLYPFQSHRLYAG